MCEKNHEAFLTNTAEMIVSVSEAAHPGDPVAAAAMALNAVRFARLPGDYRGDLEAPGQGDGDRELFADAAADYDAMEAGEL